MREIKFRAWDGKMMIDPVWAWDKSSNHFEHYNELHENWMYGLGVENVTLMQFTGLLDEHGVEIYEGDVCQWISATTVVTIEWDAESAAFNTRISPEGVLGFVPHFDLEVIGNIHENPELLKP